MAQNTRDVKEEIKAFRDWQNKKEKFCKCGKRAKHVIILSSYSGHYCDDCYNKTQDKRLGIVKRD
jgi:hypothetical protein